MDDNTCYTGKPRTKLFILSQASIYYSSIRGAKKFRVYYLNCQTIGL